MLWVGYVPRAIQWNKWWQSREMQANFPLWHGATIRLILLWTSWQLSPLCCVTLCVTVGKCQLLVFGTTPTNTIQPTLLIKLVLDWSSLCPSIFPLLTFWDAYCLFSSRVWTFGTAYCFLLVFAHNFYLATDRKKKLYYIDFSDFLEKKNPYVLTSICPSVRRAVNILKWLFEDL